MQRALALSCILAGINAVAEAALFPTELPLIRDAHYPALSPDASTVCFSYRGDLWVAPATGGAARRITVHNAYDAYPCWSPDGKWIAFSSDRWGNYDIFVVPAAGGEVLRVTYHSASDHVTDWSPDGESLLFASSGRNTRMRAIYSIEIGTGRVRCLVEDAFSLAHATWAPDGRRIALIRGGGAWWRKGYRGSRAANIHIFDPAAGSMTQVTDFDGPDRRPMFSSDGESIFCVTEQFGRPNLCRIDLADGQKTPLTSFETGAVSYPAMSADGSTIVFEYDFDLWTIPTSGGEPRKLEIRGAADSRENFVSTEELTGDVQEIQVSPDGEYVAIRVHDEIFLVRPDLKNDAIRLTNSPATDYDFAWSPDGKQLVFTSTRRNGNTDMYVIDVETKQVRLLLQSPEYEHNPRFGPRGKRIYFTRGYTGSLHSIPADGGPVKDLHPGPFVGRFRFSPDHRWILFDKRDMVGTRDLWIMPIDGGEAVNITKHPGSNTAGQWSPDGKRVFFLSYRRETDDIYAIDLQRKPTTFADYEAQDAKKEDKDEQKGEKKDEQAKPKKPIKPITIDFDRIEDRVTRLTRTEEDESNLALSPKGDKLVYTLRVRGERQVWSIEPDGENAKQFIPGKMPASNLRWQSDGSTLFFLSDGALKKVGEEGGSAGTVSFKATMQIDSREDQLRAFEQGWALLDERFYDPEHHGVDWAAMRERYGAHVDGGLPPRDLHNLMARMIGELNASHLSVSGGERSGPLTGFLGLWLDPEYTGPGVRVIDVMPEGPTDKPESRVEPGEYVLEIDGEPVENNERLYENLNDRIDKRVQLKVARKPGGKNARIISVKPIGRSAWYDLFYDRWVRQRREMARQLSDGRVYYLHIRSMDSASLDRFARELHGEAQRHDALLIDVRYNGGGRIHDDLLELLTRSTHAYRRYRNVERQTSPLALFDGPRAVLINEYSASDAEIFPNGFREKGLGKLVGMPTVGAVI
ncbi:MAG: DPP IV N-terminal domain-containing protein, partial [Armatimonadota bacterium]